MKINETYTDTGCCIGGGYDADGIEVYNWRQDVTTENYNGADEMNAELQDFMKQVLANPCGWTTTAKLMWFILGSATGVFVSAIFAYLMKRKENKNERNE